MFKLESYITPILLSYVSRYINNFKPEDFQVSLWGGDACFLNLELNLQVLEQELQLPFSFVSGSIRELLIHVPWTKLASEPIVITINTIECILNLKGKDSARNDTVVQNKEKQKSHSKEVEAPPGYVQLLINKIVNNIRIYCNNVILKYVEEDIVLSMNVKHLKFESANEKWEPSYIDLSPAQVILRKVITVNDLTVCLDKRNASGKIEVYQEPMLYRCSMTMHLLRNYHSATASKASTTRLDILCNNMEFSMTEQQVPMLCRLLNLLYTLQQKQLKPERNSSSDNAQSQSEARDSSEHSKTWTGWAWSYVSSVLPAPWEEEWNEEDFQGLSGHTLHFGFYLDYLSITFKISELSSDRGSYYGHKKMRYNPMLTLQLQGIYCETVIHGRKWLNSTGGISQALLLPLGQCSCSVAEVNDESPVPYLKLGSVSSSHKTDSLFDAEAVENKGQRRQYNTNWDTHMSTYTESVLLERTPAFSFDFVYQMELPSDMSSEILSDLGSDYEYSNLSEVSSMRICFGPFRLRLCSGFFHRISTLQMAASFCDYAPYFTPKPDLPLQDLLPPSTEDFDALSEFIPSRNIRITFFAPIIELELMDHPYFKPSKGQLLRKRNKMSTISQTPVNLPKLTIECQFLDISLDFPMYVNRVVHTTCQLPDPPEQMFNACYSWLNVKVVSLCSRLVLGPDKHTTILTPSSLSYSRKSILKPQYWTNPNIPHEETTFESENLTLNGTNAKLVVIAHIVEKMIEMDCEGCSRLINSTSLLRDAAKDNSLPYMEVCIEGVQFRRVVTNATNTIDVRLGSVKAFIFEPVGISATCKDSVQNQGKDIQQVLFISGPEPKTTDKRTTGPTEVLPLFTATLQYPLKPDLQKHPPILLFNLQEIRICVDPLLCRWFLYKPKQVSPFNDTLDTAPHKPKSISEASGSETPRRISSQIESVHSSSDREPLQLPPKMELPKKEDGVDMQEKIYNVLKTWFEVWKGMLLYGDISQCTIYFPLVSLSAVGSQGIQEAVESAVNKDRPPDIMVITLPFANVRSAQRQNITKYLKSLPVTLPDNLWSPDKSSFPWTMSISELSCYTIQYGNKLIFLKPVSLSATVGLSTRPTKVDGADPPSSVGVKTEIGYLGVCVHIDMTPIVISTSEVQVYLFASILYGLMEVASNLKPEKPKSASKTPDIVPPIMTKGSSTLSPTILKENTLDSESERTPPISTVAQDNIDTEAVKLTAWVQWTITRFTIELLSSEYIKSVEEELESLQPRLKLVIDAEDIVSSLDFQSVYLKIKSKVGSMSILHFKRTSPNSKWRPGPFSGIVMRLREDLSSSQRHEDNGFMSLTITRASCRHTHTLWGAVQKRNKDKKAEVTNQQLLSQSRYITEIVINIQPIDFVISPKTLRSFYLVLVPLLQIPLKEETTSKNVTSNTVTTINNQSLPLAYLDCQDIRIVMPSVELEDCSFLQDVVIFQVQKICLSPTAVNPICRTPLRPDIYEQAAHARILHIPGSEVEDRQYQLDLNGMMICTGTWKDLEMVFVPSRGMMSNLRGMSENPALEWNNLERGQPNMTPILNLWHITEKFDICVVAAPAMVYKDTTIICGHSVEINFVTDIFVNLSLQQIRLMAALLGEAVLLLEPFIVEEYPCRRPKLQFPYSLRDVSHKKTDTADATNVDVLRDSGIDVSDMRSVLSLRAQGTASTLKTVIESEKQPVFPRPPNPLPQPYSVVPIEVLLTAGKISLGLYETDVITTSSLRHKGKKKKVRAKVDEDLGYEAEEESFDDSSDKKYIPLVYICVNQPNAFLSKQQLGKKMQISCFDLNLKLNGPEYMPIAHIPTEDNFSISLLETRSGIPHPTTGILPAFFTMMYSKGIGKNSTLDIDISKPTKILCSASKWDYLITIKDKVLDTFKGSQRNLVVIKRSISKATTPVDIPPYTRTKIGDSYNKFQDIKDLLGGTNSVNVRFNQMIFSVKSDSGHEVNLGIEKLKSHLSLSSRPEKLSNTLKLESITISVMHDTFKKLLLNPWTISFDFCLFWESWQSLDSDPQIQITAESDCIVLDVCPEQIKCLEIVSKEISEFVSSLPAKEKTDTDIAYDIMKTKYIEKDQHYKDDLRAGAFQFIDSTSDNTDELPLPYQVMFWNKTISAMAWRYPQPRALTKVRVFPVPYKMTLNTHDNLMVLCHLEYWSECRNCYLPFTQFYLSESEVCHLSLPDNSPQPVVASTWRVVITMVIDNEEVPDSSLISPRALAACMRIDSYFNKTLIPNLTAAVYVTKIDVSLYSHFDKHSKWRLPECVKNYSSDLQFPESQKFITLTWDNLTSYFSSWDLDVISIEVNSATKCTVLDYMFLSEQTLIMPFTSKLEINLANSLHCKFISRPVTLKVNQSLAHTLAVSSQQWFQSYRATENGEQDFVVMTRYIICNNSNINIRFGQAGTEEDILLAPNQFNLYTWRSQKKKQTLKVALEENNWIWSKPFQVFEEGMQTIQFSSEKNFAVLVSVKALSATQKQVIISGQLTITNMLTEHFELKVAESGSDKKEAEYKNSPTYVVPGKSSTLSIFTNSRKTYILRLRFYGLESAWTGDIPLKEHATGSQPWLVKVPLQERGQFLSIWCRIIIQEVQKVKRTLAVLWPLFTVKSNLPINAEVHIETPMLNVRLDAIVKGKGEMQQLYCPGTIDHSHQLTFKLDKSNSRANPYVPLNYSLVDHQNFFKKPEKQDIEDILSVLNKFNETNWPYFGDELDNIEWIVDDQPLTHVQVRYQNACLYSCSLLVELIPWCLMVNTLGTPIAIMLNGTELCRLQHHGIVAPPKLEENFNLVVYIGGIWYFSDPLQLTLSDWSQTFYMPKFMGTIPLDGSIKTVIRGESHVCVVSLTSSIANEMRLLRVSSTHVLSNHMTMQMQVVCLAVPEGDEVFKTSRNNDQYSFTVAPHLNKNNCGVPIIQWRSVRENHCECATEYALYMAFCVKPELGWSCPIRVDKPLLRKSFCVMGAEHPIPMVLTSQEQKGQIFLGIHNDTRPQMFIENKTPAALFCAQSLGEDEVAKEVQHFKWYCSIGSFKSMYYTMPYLSEKFPELPQNNYAEKIALACDPETDEGEFQWSTSISIIADTELFVRIPYYGDIRLTILNSACTTFIIIDSVSQVEISARDIRVRLTLHENEKSSKHTTEAAAEPNDFYTSGDVSRSLSETSVTASAKSSSIFQTLPTVSEQSYLNQMGSPLKATRRWSDTNMTSVACVAPQMFLVNTLPMKEKWSCVKIDAYVRSFTVTLMSDMEKEGTEGWEMANVICDSIAVSATQAESMNVKMSVYDIQFDNQLYAKESFDFPVVLVGQEENKPNVKLPTLNVPMENLLESADANTLFIMDATLETWRDQCRADITGIKEIKVTVNPLSCYVEDIYITRLMEYLNVYVPTKLVLWPRPKARKIYITSGLVSVPEIISWQCSILAKPLTIRNFSIAPVSLLLSVHSSIKMYIALDQSPLQFAKFERRRLFTTPYRLGHALTMHYLSGAIFGAGWVVSSLELLGSPGGLARAMGTGLRDFVSLPYRGLVVGPTAFLRGITQGSASLMKHVTAGTLQSVTKLASSVARNLDRLTLDEEHLKRTEEQRRQRPQGLAEGFFQGLTGLGISLLGAIGGIAHHPLQSVMVDGASPRSLAAGVGLGLVGVFTKPLSGAAELVALTGQGLLQGAGWNLLPKQRSSMSVQKIQYSPNSNLKYTWKLINTLYHTQILYVAEGTSISENPDYKAVTLILTIDALIVINTDDDVTERIISLSELNIVENKDPTMLEFKLTPPLAHVKPEDDTVIEMDPASRARVADYVKSTLGILNLPMLQSDHSDISISPLSSPGIIPDVSPESTVLNFYVNPQSKNYFLRLLALAKHHRHNYTFPVL